MRQASTDLKLRARLRLAARLMVIAAGGIWRLSRTALRLVLETVLALLIAFEEWGWRPLAAALARLGRLAPVARLEAAIGRLPPYGALAVFAVPSVALVPLKLLAVFLIATGHGVSAALLFVAAKIVGTALVARLFQLTERQLLEIAWFRRGYEVVMPWKERLVAWVRTSWAWRQGRLAKVRLRRLAARIVLQWRRRFGGP